MYIIVQTTVTINYVVEELFIPIISNHKCKYLLNISQWFVNG